MAYNSSFHCIKEIGIYPVLTMSIIYSIVAIDSLQSYAGQWICNWYNVDAGTETLLTESY